MRTSLKIYYGMSYLIVTGLYLWVEVRLGMRSEWKMFWSVAVGYTGLMLLLMSGYFEDSRRGK